MMHVVWGVWCAEGFVVKVYDGPSAFREEKLRRHHGWHDAQAVVSRDGGETWRRVPWSSTLRPDPRPPFKPSATRSAGVGLPRVPKTGLRGWWAKWRGLDAAPGPVFKRNNGWG